MESPYDRLKALMQEYESQPYMGQGVRVGYPIGGVPYYTPMSGPQQFLWDLENDPRRLLDAYIGQKAPEVPVSPPVAQNPPPPQMPPGYDPMIDDYPANRPKYFGR